MSDRLSSLAAALSSAFGTAQPALFESAAQPVMCALGLANHLEDAFDRGMWLLAGLAPIAAMRRPAGRAGGG
jgi:hypothetical protein